MFLQESYERGFLFQCTDLEALKEKTKSPIIAYLGFDATAPSLHVGNLVGIMWLRLLQKHGHTPLVLLGDATTKIGDPSGKDSQRKMLSAEQIAQNIHTIKQVFYRFLGPDVTIVQNESWLGGVKYLDFLRDFGHHFTINRMLTFDSVKLRLEREQPLTFLEFNYMLLQAYDFLHLFKTRECCLQLGGSDQWGNIVNGVELVRRSEGQSVFGMTAPLVTTASGAKMGKSEKGAIWLNSDMVSPYEYWQFWRNTDDRDVLRYMKLFTDLPVEEIESYALFEGVELNTLKCTLADEATKLAHGEDVLKEVHAKTNQFFGDGHQKDALPCPSLPVRCDQLFLDLGLVASKGEFRRLVEGQGIRLNDITLEDVQGMLTREHFNDGYLKLSVGKKKHQMLKL